MEVVNVCLGVGYFRALLTELQTKTNQNCSGVDDVGPANLAFAALATCVPVSAAERHHVSIRAETASLPGKDRPLQRRRDRWLPSSATLRCACNAPFRRASLRHYACASQAGRLGRWWYAKVGECRKDPLVSNARVQGARICVLEPRWLCY